MMWRSRASWARLSWAVVTCRGLARAGNARKVLADVARWRYFRRLLGRVPGGNLKGGGLGW